MIKLFISVWIHMEDVNAIAKGDKYKVVGFSDFSFIGEHPYESHQQKEPDQKPSEFCQILLSSEDWEIVKSKESKFNNQLTLKKKEKGLIGIQD